MVWSGSGYCVQCWGGRDYRRTLPALAGTHCTKYVDIQQVVKQSQPVSRTTVDKLGLLLTRMIRISTVICYASLGACRCDWKGRSLAVASLQSRESLRWDRVDIPPDQTWLCPPCSHVDVSTIRQLPFGSHTKTR